MDFKKLIELIESGFDDVQIADAIEFLGDTSALMSEFEHDNHMHEIKIERLQAEIDALKNAQMWQLIESAPRDGTPIIVYTPNSRKQVKEAWWAIPYEGATDGYWSTPNCSAGRGYIILPESATHWTPLPPAPETAK